MTKDYGISDRQTMGIKANTRGAEPPRGDLSGGMTLFVMVVATLYFGKEVMIPVTLALLLAFILAPIVNFLERLHLGKVLSVIVSVILAVGMISAVGGVIGAQIGDLSTDLPSYIATAQTKLSQLKQHSLDELSKLASNVDGHHDTANLPLGIPALGLPGSVSPTSAPAHGVQGTSPVDLAQRYLAPVLAPLANLGIIFIVTVFALLQRDDLRDRLIRLMGSGDMHRSTQAIDEAASRLSRYFIVQISINALFGIAIGLGLYFIGVPNPVLWGILSALLRFVPYVGSIISAVLPLMMAAAAEPGWSMTFSTAILYLVAEGVTGQAIEPLVYGHSTGLSPFSVIVAAIFWSWVWGPIGLIFSTPLTLCLVVIGRHVKKFEFLDVALGDRAPLTPVETFYQRILAGDADEVQDQAERLLRDRPLSTYYDEVAIKGLRLAAQDAHRGALDDNLNRHIGATVRHLIEGLDRHSDKQPPAKQLPENAPVVTPDEGESLPRNPVPASVGESGALPAPWRGPRAVLCVAGRDPLDALAGEMLVQLLHKHGLGAELVDYNRVSRDAIVDLDLEGVAIICIVTLAIYGAPAHLRYLAQRLCQRLPENTPVAIGLWPDRDPAANDTEARAPLGADYLVSSLEETVNLCVRLAKSINKAAT